MGGDYKEVFISFWIVVMKNNKLKYSEVIATKVKDGVRNGVSIRDLLASIQKYQNAPRSMSTFYKLYGEDIAEVKVDVIGKVGGVVVQKALEGDFKAAELFLRSKGGWSPTQTNIEVEQDEDQDMDEAAIDSLLALLGKEPDDTEEDNG